MAFSRKSRLPFLCAISLLVGSPALMASLENPQPSSWFDQQLKTKSEALVSRVHEEDERDVLIGIGLLDEIWELREEVSCPNQVDALLNNLAADGAAKMPIRLEAKHLIDATTAANELDRGEEARALLHSSGENAHLDVEVENALVAINIAHHWHKSSEALRAAELTQNAEAWYRASRAAEDDYHRFQSARHALDLDRNYVPALVDLARHYFAQGQLTRARSILTAALENSPNESSVSALLAEIEINQGRGSVALSIMNELRSKPLPIAVARELANRYAQLGFLKEARELAAYALNLHPNGHQERELVSRLDEQAGNPEPIAGDHQQTPSNALAHREERESSEREWARDDPDTERLRRFLNGEAGGITRVRSSRM
jgi:tetratricopeptide (TPR) repeat protein